jgi:hypothetical protein
MSITFDGGDIDNHGHWRMNGVSCLGCREEVSAYLSLATPVRMFALVLACEECGEPFTPAFDQFTGEVL